MTAIAKSLGLVDQLDLLPTATKTATFNGTGVDVSKYEGVGLAILDSAAGGGTTPTMDCKLMSSDAVGGTYADISGAVFTQVVDAAGREIITFDLDAAAAFVRVTGTITGTSPTFDVSVNLLAIPKAS